MRLPESQTTEICYSTTKAVFVRGKNLCEDLIGQLSFTEMAYFQILGRKPTPGQARLVEACLVTLMEHGLTPSAITTRLTYTGAPEAMQAAVAAGLMGVGSLFAGTMDGCGKLLERMVQSAQPLAEAALAIAQEHREAKIALPGFGHPNHKPDDPRSVKLLALAREEKVAGSHIAALEALSGAIDTTYGKHITINATGAIAAVLADCEVPPEILRGFALIARCAGLVGHIHEEQRRPAMRALWDGAEKAVPYENSQT